MIIILTDEEQDPCGSGIEEASSRVWTLTLPGERWRVRHPTWMVLSTNLQMALQKTTDIYTCQLHRLLPTKSQHANETSMTGHYNSIGPRTTTQCPASMGAHPMTKHNHHQFDTTNMQTSTLPFLSKIRNSLLSESWMVGHSCRQVITPIIKKNLQCYNLNLHPFCLFTQNFFNTPHQDANFYQ